MVSSPLPGVRMARLKTLNAACRPFTFFACTAASVAGAGRSKEQALQDADVVRTKLADVMLDDEHRTVPDLVRSHYRSHQ